MFARRCHPRCGLLGPLHAIDAAPSWKIRTEVSYMLETQGQNLKRWNLLECTFLRHLLWMLVEPKFYCCHQSRLLRGDLSLGSSPSNCSAFGYTSPFPSGEQAWRCSRRCSHCRWNDQTGFLWHQSKRVTYWASSTERKHDLKMENPKSAELRSTGIWAWLQNKSRKRKRNEWNQGLKGTKCHKTWNFSSTIVRCSLARLYGKQDTPRNNCEPLMKHTELKNSHNNCLP